MRKAAIAGLAGISAIVLLTVMSFMRHSAHIPQPDMAMERRLQEVDKAGGDTSNTAEHAQDGVTACETPTLSSILVPNAQEYANFKAKPAAPKKQHILVTGGAGYIGSHAVLALLERGHKVTIIDNLSRGNRGALTVLESIAQPGQLFTFIVDLAHATLLVPVLRGAGIDTVLHFAGVAYVAESVQDPLLYHHNITANTITLMRLAEAINVTNVVFSSTCATYGNAEHLPITEETPQRPVTPYGRAKMAAEEIVRAFGKTSQDTRSSQDRASSSSISNGQRATAILRYFNVYGSDPRGRIGEAPDATLVAQYGRISNACFDAALGKRKQLEVLGTQHNTPDGTCVRDYIHVVDLVDAHIAVMDAMRPGDDRVYNVGTGKGYSVREFVAACKAVTGRAISVVEKDAREGDAAAVYADVSKIREEVGWRARFTSLDTGLLTAWRWARAHPHGYETSQAAS